jgi:hypothetical protein
LRPSARILANAATFPATLDQHGIAELVGAIVVGFQLFAGAAQGGIVGEGAKQIIMAGARLVSAGEDSIDDAQVGSRANPFCRQALASVQAAVARR